VNPLTVNQFYDDPTYTIAELSQLIVEFNDLDDNVTKAFFLL